MGPPEETTAAAHAAAEAAAIEENLTAKISGDRPISTIVIVVAMQTEALPLVAKFELSEDLDRSVFPKGVPWVRYHGTYKGLHINLVWPGKDAVSGVDSVGTVSASLLTYASIQAFKPDLIINAGTAGGFQAKGASIVDVYLASDVAFHDRRIPIPVFDLYGIGARRTFSTPKLVKQLSIKVAAYVNGNFHMRCVAVNQLNRNMLEKVEYGIPTAYRVGKLSTGDSLDMCPQDESLITANDATLKDMEGAAVAYVADLLSVPAILIKAVTDIVDGPKPTAKEFMENVVAVSAALHYAVTEVVDFISGKSLADL